MEYDVIIIGGGPAGLSAAIYAARYKLKTAVLTKTIGGLASTAHRVCNFPSYKDVNGYELMQKFKDQVEELEVPIIYEGAIRIEKTNKGFCIHTNKSKYKAKKVIFSGGTSRVKLNVEGENKFLGRGVSYCATCDAAFFKEKVVAVVGGSDAALTAALLLAEHAKKVHIIYRGTHFHRGEPSWVELVEKEHKIKVHFEEEILEIIGEKKVDKLKLKSGKEINLDGVFIEVGSIPEASILNEMAIKMKNGYITTDKYQRTNVEGLFAAGDVTENVLKQIITASSEGAVAAYSAYCELKKNK